MTVYLEKRINLKPYDPLNELWWFNAHRKQYMVHHMKTMVSLLHGKSHKLSFLLQCQ